MKENNDSEQELGFTPSNKNMDINNFIIGSNSDKNNDLLGYLYDNNLNQNNISYNDEIESKHIFSKTLRNQKNFEIYPFTSRKAFSHSNIQQNEPLLKKKLEELFLKNDERKKNKPKDVNPLEKNLIEMLYDKDGEGEDSEENENEDIIEENNIEQNNDSRKIKNFVKLLMDTKREKDWNEYLKSYKERVKESQTLKFKLKNIFHMESDFVVIWKTTLRIFHIFILFIFLLKYIFLNIAKDDKLIIPKRILILYDFINYMFIADLIISILIILFNGGSKLTYFKLPLKLYTCIPFKLKRENLILLLPKFIRIDIFQKIFSSWESYINLQIEFYIHNYQMRIFIACLTQIVKYLLIFGLYAHINCCILSYFEDFSYPSSLFYTIEAFTVVGFGEKSPVEIQSIFLVILNLFVGVNLFTLMTSNIKDLSDRINSFYRETSYWDNFENITFQIQKSTGKILPSKTKQLMISYLLFRKGLSSHDLKEEFETILSFCNNNLLEKIRQQIFHFLKLEYQNYFSEYNDDFMFDIFENLKPKIYKKNRILIKKGEKVNKLYFLLNGQIYARDYKNKPTFLMMNNGIFGDYEFITNTYSIFDIQVDPNRNAYGFILDKESWEKIAKKHIKCSKYFIKQICTKRKIHMQWINYKKKQIFDEIPEKKEDEEENNYLIDTNLNNKNKENILNIQNSEEEKINKIKKLISRTPASKKNPSYIYSNIDIIKDINVFQTKINQIEFHFIDNKEKILNKIKKNFNQNVL